MVGTNRLNSECYIRDCSLDLALEWMRDTLGTVRCVESEDILLFEASHEGSPISITFTSGIEDGPYCSVYCGGNVLPWESDADMARAAFAFTRLPVRWGAHTIDPHDWWQLDADGQRRIAWD